MTLPKIVSLREATQISGKSARTLRAMIQSGKIQGGKIDGAVFVSTKSLSPKIETKKEDQPEYKKFVYLNESKIWVSEAARKYNIPHPTISRWVKLGFIKHVSNTGNKVMLNEQDIAYCAEIYHSRNAKQGRRLFDINGAPYKYKSTTVAG